MQLSVSDLSLLGGIFDNGKDEVVLTFFSKEHPDELNESYCKALFNQFGSFHAIENPAAKVFDKSAYYTMEAVCSLCDVETSCTVHAATRTSNLFLICKPCQQDFNMHIFNPNNKEYCRSLKQKR